VWSALFLAKRLERIIGRPTVAILSSEIGLVQLNGGATLSGTITGSILQTGPKRTLQSRMCDRSERDGRDEFGRLHTAANLLPREYRSGLS